LYWTCFHKNLIFTKYIIEHKARIEEVADPKTGNYPIHVAFNTKNPNDMALILYLCSIGADLNCLNKKK